jgi:hypothetical protein
MAGDLSHGYFHHFRFAPVARTSISSITSASITHDGDAMGKKGDSLVLKIISIKSIKQPYPVGPSPDADAEMMEAMEVPLH